MQKTHSVNDPSLRFIDDIKLCGSCEHVHEQATWKGGKCWMIPVFTFIVSSFTLCILIFRKVNVQLNFVRIWLLTTLTFHPTLRLTFSKRESLIESRGTRSYHRWSMRKSGWSVQKHKSSWPCTSPSFLHHPDAASLSTLGMKHSSIMTPRGFSPS